MLLYNDDCDKAFRHVDSRNKCRIERYMVSRSSFYLLDDIWRFLQYEAENKGKGSLNGFSSIEWSLIENLGALIPLNVETERT